MHAQYLYRYTEYDYLSYYIHYVQYLYRYTEYDNLIYYTKISGRDAPLILAPELLSRTIHNGLFNDIFDYLII